MCDADYFGRVLDFEERQHCKNGSMFVGRHNIEVLTVSPSNCIRCDLVMDIFVKPVKITGQSFLYTGVSGDCI